MPGTVFESVAEFEARLGLPGGFYEHLIKEDDWSFVIKLSALFEAACTHILTVRLGQQLQSAFANLDFAHPKTGKITMLRAIGALTADQQRVLRTLAELRNSLVHDISSVSFSFKQYVATMDANQLSQLLKTYGHGVADTIRLSRRAIPRAKFVRSNPKYSLWLTCAEVLACLYLEIEMAQIRLRNFGDAQ